MTHAVEYLRKRTPRRSLLMIAGVWVLSAVISLPPLVGWKKPEKPSDYPECLLSDDVGYVLYSAFGSFYVPAFVMVFVYCRIFVAARSRARRHLKQRQKAAAELTTTACDPAKSTTTTTTTCTSFSNASPTRPAPPLEKIPESNGDGPPVVVVVAAPAPEIVIDEEEAPLPPPSPSAEDATVPSPDASRCQLFVAEAQPRRTSLLRAPKFLKSPFGSTLSLAELGRSEEDLGDLGSGGGGKKKGGKKDKAANKKKAHQDSTEAPRRQQPATTEAERQRRRIARAKERRATLILGLIMASFILAWLPFFVLYVLEALCRSACDIGATGFAIAFWLGYCNSALNPIIYTIFNRDFRRAFRKILFK